MQEILNRLEKQLQQRQQAGKLRSLPQLSPTADFYSNDYLGFARSETLAGQIKKAVAEWNAPVHGATGSRLISGNMPLSESVEQLLAEWLQAESCLLYGSGYAANQGLLSAILQRGDTVIYDELAHACIKDGCRLSPADRYTFRHNDLGQLKAKLSRARGQKVVVVESVYSMDGDEAPLAGLVELCQHFGAGLVVDEAHSTGIWGADGAGSCVAAGVKDSVLARVHTFGKAMGTHGACVAGSPLLKQYLINYSRPFIYTTAMPAHSLLALREAVLLRKKDKQAVEALFRNIDYFKALVQQEGTALSTRLLPSNSPVQAVLVPGNEQVRQLAAVLQQKGWGIWPILAPTVPEGQERLRICLHSFNTRQEMHELVQELNKALA